MKDTKFPAFDKTKLPDPNGIPFEGIEGAEIPGRKEVAKKINGFIAEAKRSKAIEIQLITAAWGEGKTDAYGRYIKNHSERNRLLSMPNELGRGITELKFMKI